VKQAHQSLRVTLRKWASITTRGGCAIGLAACHGLEKGTDAPFDPVAIAFVDIGQHGGNALYPAIGHTHEGPEHSRYAQLIASKLPM
jgi:hypothetical protein